MEFCAYVYKFYHSLFKLEPCRFKICPDPEKCVFFHSDADRRRYPWNGDRLLYKPTLCLQRLIMNECENGDDCDFAHNVYEAMYHPGSYKLFACPLLKDGLCPLQSEDIDIMYSERGLGKTPEGVIALLDRCPYAHGTYDQRPNEEDGLQMERGFCFQPINADMSKANLGKYRILRYAPEDHIHSFVEFKPMFLRTLSTVLKNPIFAQILDGSIKSIEFEGCRLRSDISECKDVDSQTNDPQSEVKEDQSVAIMNENELADLKGAALLMKSWQYIEPEKEAKSFEIRKPKNIFEAQMIRISEDDCHYETEEEY